MSSRVRSACGAAPAFLLLCSLVSLLLRTASAATCYQSFSRTEYPNCLQLDPQFVVHWAVDANVSTIKYAVDGDGFMAWFGVGLSEAGRLGFDLAIVARATQGQSWSVGDYFSVDENPLLDNEQNVELIQAPVMDKTNRTTAVFTRPLDTCDPADVAIVQGSERSLTWAYGYGKWEAAKANFFNTTQGTVVGFILWPKPNSTVALPADHRNLTLAMPSYAVPAADSSLACVNFALPNDMPYHAVRYEGMRGSPVVHHFNMFACAVGVMPPQPLGMAYECPKLPVGCETLQFMWAPGAVAFTAPQEAGFAFGNGSSTYYVLQAHYQNPKRLNMTDTSGFLVTYTPTLRNASLGVLTLGSNDINVPPEQEYFQVAPNTCPADCTGARVTAPVTMVSNFFLMNSKGRSIYTRHIRNGTALQPLGARNYFDARYTGFQAVPANTSTLLPYDTLITICTYNTSKYLKYNTTYGLGPNQELCFNYVTFYPASAMPQLDICIANTLKNTSTCMTRSRQANLTALNQTQTQLIKAGAVVSFTPVSVEPWTSAYCKAKEGEVVDPLRPPNTKGAIASILVTIMVLLALGLFLYYKFQRKEEMEALLAEIRRVEAEDDRMLPPVVVRS